MGEECCEQGQSGKPKWQQQVFTRQLASPKKMMAPAPQAPKRQRPSRPGKPNKEFAQAQPDLRFSARHCDTPAPEIQGTGHQCNQAGDQHRLCHHGGSPAACYGLTGMLLCFGTQQAQRATQAQQHRHARGARQRQCSQAQPHAEQRQRFTAWGRCKTIKNQCRKTELRQTGGGFVGGLCQTQAGDQGQQGAIRQGSGIVSGLGFTAKGKGKGLCLGAACKMVGPIPSRYQGQGEQRNRGNANGIVWPQPSRRQLYGPSP